MSATVEELAKATLQLDLDDRAELAARLLLSLDDPEPSEINRLWDEEALRRLEAYRRGETAAIPAEEVFRRVLADLS
jgi:putative addiction module component (TIGR02574 family)